MIRRRSSDKRKWDSIHVVSVGIKLGRRLLICQKRKEIKKAELGDTKDKLIKRNNQ